MAIYAVAYSSGGSTAVPKELFQIQASTNSFLRVHAIHVGQSTGDYTGATEVELCAITVHRGSSLDAAGGSTAVPVNLDARQTSTATFTTLVNSSSPGSSGTSAKLVHAGVMATGQPFCWKPEFPVIVGLSERLQVRMSAPNAAITTNAVVYVEEIGKNPNA